MEKVTELWEQAVAQSKELYAVAAEKVGTEYVHVRAAANAAWNTTQAAAQHYNALATEYFETLAPGHGAEIVVALAAVAVTTLVLLLVVLPCCCCCCCRRRGGRRGRKSRAPVVLLLGVPGAGKTALLTRLVHGEMGETHTSQTENVVADVDLGAGVHATVVDTPGHQRVRGVWRSHVGRSAGARGATHIVFAVNAVDVRAEADRVAEYLYDVLADDAVQAAELPVLLLCTKADLATALPVDAIVPLLEHRLQQLRDAQRIDARDRGDIVGAHAVPDAPFVFGSAACPCTFAAASARTGSLDAIAQFVREM